MRLSAPLRPRRYARAEFPAFVEAPPRNPHGIFTSAAAHIGERWTRITSDNLLPAEAARPHHGPKEALPELMLGAIGVVYGDIGTSPLYTMKESFLGPHPLAVDPLHIFGVLSLIFWSLMLVVTIKYVFVAMRADNKRRRRLVRLAVADLAQPRPQEMGADAGHARRARDVPVLRRRDDHPGDLGPVGGRGADDRRGAASAAGDPDLDRHPDRLCSSSSRAAPPRSGTLFGPVILVYMAVLGALGVTNILAHPEVLGALNPHWAVKFFLYNPKLAFLALGSVFLAVTGAETLYADMGHFGRRAIGFSWLTLVYPCLTLNYLGQGALMLGHPEAAANPFYLMAPDWARLPLVGIATAATIIASQAVISRRLLGHPPGGPARLPAAAQDRAYQRESRRPDLHPGGQLGPAGDGHRARRSDSANPAGSRRPMASR